MIKQWVKRVVEVPPYRDEKTAVITERSTTVVQWPYKPMDEGSNPSVPIAPSPNGKASGFGSDYCRFESGRGCAAVAQMAE